MVVTVNSGSTSIKLAVWRVQGGAAERLAHEQQSGALRPQNILAAFLQHAGIAPDVIVHRVVHGGTRFTTPVKLDDEVLQEIGKLSELAPLHNPKALEWITAARHCLPRRDAGCSIRHCMVRAAAASGGRVCIGRALWCA